MHKNETVGVEIERKYIIKMPSILLIKGQSNYTESEILQIYLPSEKGETRRIRRRVYGDKTLCTETKKMRIDGMSATEIEREISLAEFDELALSIKQGTTPVNKTRYTFISEGQLFEIDVYPQWKRTAIMETELENREAKVKIPDFLEILREVTGDKSYSNAAMSRDFPPEDI